MSLSNSAQINSVVDYSIPETYQIGGITVNGANNLNNSTLVAISGLSIGKPIKIPGEEQVSTKNFGSKDYFQT